MGLKFAAATLAALALAGPAAAETAQEAANVKLVLDMWKGVIEERSDAAVMKYIAPGYIQHNVNVSPGREGLLEGLRVMRNPPPGLALPGKKTLVKAVAQDDMVVLIWSQPQPDPTAPGKTYDGAAFDMFRIEKGMVAEHWDDTRKSVQPWRPAK